jgi:SAM-dependent methyltransferase
MGGQTHGYDVSVGYSYSVYPEVAPDWLNFCARLAGVEPPRGGAPAYRYLELGCGQGFGLCLLAAANPQAEFVGVDFLPDHVAHGRALAARAGLANIRFSAADFVDLADDWPADFDVFDYVTAHGVYSWISPAVRAALVRCLDRATRPGSLVYLGYNAQPGWLATMPFQHISRRIKEATGKPGDAVFADSLALFDRLRAGGANSFRILPGLQARLDSVRGRETDYLVHEYLHESWHPLWHSQVARELAVADLRYVGTATAAETMLPAALPPPLRDAIAEQADPALREDVQDFVINQSFRRDIFRKGQTDRRGARPDAFAVARLCLGDAPDPGRDLEVKAAFGEISLQPPAFAPIVQALRAGPASLAQIAAALDPGGKALATLRRIVLLLLHARVLAIAPDGPDNVAAVRRMNAIVAAAVADGTAYRHLAAATLRAPVAASEEALLLLHAWLAADGRADAPTLTAALAGRLGTARALERAQSFLDRDLPRWRALGVLG